MKKITLLTLIAVLSFCACEKEKGGNENPLPLKNQFQFGDQRYSITDVTETYYGSTDAEGKVNFRLEFATAGDAKLSLDITCNHFDRIPSGSYGLSMNLTSTGDVTRAAFFTGNEEVILKTGTLNVSEELPSFDLDAQSTEGVVFKLKYEGPVIYKDESGGEEPGPLDNEFEFEETRYTVTSVTETYYGDRRGNGIDNFELLFAGSENTQILLELYVDGSERITSGDYDIGSAHTAGSISVASAWIGGRSYVFTRGNLTVTAGNDQAFALECRTADGKVLQLDYTGDVAYLDESEEPQRELENEVRIGNEIYQIIGMSQSYWGDEYGSGTANVDLIIQLGPARFAIIELFEDIQEVKLTGGNYVQNYSLEPHTINDAYYSAGGSEYDLTFTKFTATPTGQDLYSFVIEGRTDNGYDFECVYHGEVEHIWNATPPTGTGYLKYEGEEVAITMADCDYFGQAADFDIVNSVITFSGENDEMYAEVWLDILYPQGELPMAGVYVYEPWDDEDEEPNPYTIMWGEVEIEEFDVYGTIGDAEIEIEVSGEVYTVTGQFETEDGDTIEIYYRGAFNSFEMRSAGYSVPVTKKQYSAVKISPQRSQAVKKNLQVAR